MYNQAQCALEENAAKAEALPASDYLSLSRYLSFFFSFRTDFCETSDPGSFAKSVRFESDK